MGINKMIIKLKKNADRFSSWLFNHEKSIHLPDQILSYIYETKQFKHYSQVKHSGNAGDIIFSCLLIKSIVEETGKPLHFHIQTHVTANYVVEHPLKNVLINKKMAEQLKPLLLEQPYISGVTSGDDPPQTPYVDLDQFRKLPINFCSHLIQGWQQMCTDLWLNVHEPWITANKLPDYRNTILVARTQRLRSDYIDYKFLKEFQNLLFVGLPQEFSLFQKETNIDCPFLLADDFKQLAALIHSCRLVISNQGFIYTLAESLQSPRVLESNSIAPNNFPMSSNGRIALFQKPFEGFVRSMLRET